MNPYKVALRLQAKRLSQGGFIKLRQAYPNPIRMLRALRTVRSGHVPSSVDDRIVLVGVGPAGLACIRALDRHGFRNVVVLKRDDLAGGKCVNFGCMPVEYVLSRPAGQTATQIREGLGEFVTALRADADAAIQASKFPCRIAAADRIEGKCVVLADGERLEFDRLIVATGARYSTPRPLDGDPRLISIEDFWSLPPGSHLVIYAESNPAAISLGFVARRLGIEVTVLLARSNPLGNLPSFRYFLREARNAGVIVYDSVRLAGGDRGSLTILHGAASVSLRCEFILPYGLPSSAFLPIDGRVPQLHDVDIARGSLPRRPDISFVGDTAGLMSVSEAELHANALISSWRTGEALDLRELNGLPVNIHGAMSLAMVGPEWMYAERDWHELDFRALSWTKVHERHGKVWFKFDAGSNRIAAIHICHDDAAALIVVAAALMEFPVHSPKWQQKVVHPSAFEIFRLIANFSPRSPDDQTATANPPAELPEADATLRLSNDVLESEHRPEWLSEAAWCQAMLSDRPKELLALYLGVSHLAEICGSETKPKLRQLAAGGIPFQGAPLDFVDIRCLPGQIELCSDKRKVVVRL